MAAQFLRDGRVTTVESLGEGLVNDTFLIFSDSTSLPRFVLQRINREVFPFPDRIQANLETLSRHLADREAADPSSQERPALRLPALLPGRDGSPSIVSDSGDYWRALSYVENSTTLERIESSEDAGEVGFALANFHEQVRDLNPDRMQDSLPGFHVTSGYLAQYERIVAAGAPSKPTGNAGDHRYCEQTVTARRPFAGVLEKAFDEGRLKRQVVHGDPKLNNILFDLRTRKALTLIDLDTVKAGLIHFDIGDCLRSSCNRAGESCAGGTVEFDLDICEAILDRYFEQCGRFLTADEIEHLYPAIRLLPFELGLRFFSDYLDGNRYFKVDTPDQNLVRATVQFRLLQSVEEKERPIRALIRKLARRSVIN